MTQMINLIKCTLYILMLVSLGANSTTSDISGGGLKSAGNIVVGEKFRFKSSVLDEQREIFVSLPESYSHSVHDYPVIYVLDGEFLFDLTSSTVKLRSARNYMPESIIVGIPNNTGRRVDMAMELVNDEGVPFFYGDNLGQADKYLSFFRKDLIPEIEKLFRVNNHRTIIGLSPTFGPVLEAFWSQPDLFSGYIVLAAEIGQKHKSGETIADKLVKAISDSNRAKASIYIGTSSGDIKKRGVKEAALYANVPALLKKSANPDISYKFEINQDEDHYGMSIPGIHHGLNTIYPRDVWNINYRNMWNSPNPAKALAERYKELSSYYGFEIVPIEKSFFSIHSIMKTAEIMNRQDKVEQLVPWLLQALKYYPRSPELHSMLAAAYAKAGKNQLSLDSAKKAKELRAMVKR